MTLPVRRGRYGARQRDPFGRWALENVFDQMTRRLSAALPDVARITVNSWAPPVAVDETDTEFVVEADLPGVRPEDVAIDLRGRNLRITGQYARSEQTEGEQGTTGRRSGRFDYRVTLPAEIDADSCSAELENGVLRLRLPKVAPTPARRIPVQGSGAQQAEGGPTAPAGTAAQPEQMGATGGTGGAPQPGGGGGQG